MRGGFLLAMSVIDEHLVESLEGEPHPRRRRFAKELHEAACCTPRRERARSRMRIGVLSDTHGLLRPEVLAAFAGAKHILHAGDIGDVEVLRDLEKMADVTAVAGNIDGFRCGKARETARVELGGVRFFLTHILDRPRRLRPQVAWDL